MSTYRTGGHWRVTIVEEGTQPYDESGHRPDARLRAIVMDGKVLTTDPELAERVCALLNDSQKTDWVAFAQQLIADMCTGCTAAKGDPDCPVHHGRKPRGPKPPNPPGCICDGSGRTCPRHGAVI